MSELAIGKELANGMYFGESPRYRDGLLYVSDMIGRKIYTIDVSSGTKQVFVEVENQPNGMCFHPDGSLVYSSMFDAKLYRLKDGKSTLYADMSHVMTGYCGDMVIDKSGRVYLDDTGARVLHGETPRPGRVLIVETDGTVKVAADDIVFPNAIFISNDGKYLYVAETFRYGLLRYDVEADGQLSNRQDFWSPTVLPGVKKEDMVANMIGIDGGCMDAEGGIWLSMLGYEEFVRLDPQGNVTHRIKAHGHATACTLGGDDGKTLYLVINKVPADENLFKAMVGKRTTCTITTASVEVGRGEARP
ncbi:calcium-dependent phosphotriesterase [Melanomma pulvis-pyrius CBS 109.77]|uniref:Calcium-dependent phosphotriesterase n=1 Tax=Melanomma pulvis-pyrius CBS 109.77 TaxID=1314802 RepID=A0A6A6WX61_9PLEO|nr:calcium-dependent phosphotriesterase [Melanomma pulvis-pyrius CBS 109.77]